MMDIQISDEQRVIVDTFKKGTPIKPLSGPSGSLSLPEVGANLTIMASAGSGKTTTLLFLGQECPTIRILALTYNRGLCDDTKKKIKMWQLGNIEIQTYHGYCTKYYGPSFTDFHLSQYQSSAPKPALLKQHQTFDLLIIDESQDMTELYYTFLHHKLQYFKPTIKIILFGDPRQTIYQFNGGTPKYLIHPELYWPGHFTRCYLNTTYRLTPKVTEFVNTVICAKYSEPHQMKSIPREHDYPVQYYWVDLFQKGFEIIIAAVKEFGAGHVLIMACSVKEKTPVIQCVNQLSLAGVPVVVMKDEDGSFDLDIAKDKVMISSIHKQKGRERPCVIIYGLDCSYHKYYGRDKPCRIISISFMSDVHDQLGD